MHLLSCGARRKATHDHDGSRALTRTEFWSDTVAKLQAVGIVGASSMPVGHLPVGNSAQRLNCASCHSNVDPHRARFGPDCATCHATNTWLISSFEHPADQTSTDCNECHKAPPSHYMMHFKMISAARGTSGCASGALLCVSYHRCVEQYSRIRVV